jgi:hypothetical protein
MGQRSAVLPFAHVEDRTVGRIHVQVHVVPELAGNCGWDPRSQDRGNCVCLR